MVPWARLTDWVAPLRNACPPVGNVWPAWTPGCHRIFCLMSIPSSPWESKIKQTPCLKQGWFSLVLSDQHSLRMGPFFVIHRHLSYVYPCLFALGVRNMRGGVQGKLPEPHLCSCWHRAWRQRAVWHSMNQGNVASIVTVAATFPLFISQPTGSRPSEHGVSKRTTSRG